MIFDKNFDTSLWYIIKGDKKNRKEIVNFIKELPIEFIEKVRKGIEKYKKMEDSFEREEEIEEFYEASDDIVYYFNISNFGEEVLEIRKDVKNGNYYDSVIVLELIPVNQKEILEYKNFEGEELGTLTNNINFVHVDEKFGLENCNESEYNVVKTPIGYLVNYSREILDGRFNYTIGRFVNLKKMPQDINIEDLDEPKKLKLLKK